MPVILLDHFTEYSYDGGICNQYISLMNRITHDVAPSCTKLPIKVEFVKNKSIRDMMCALRTNRTFFDSILISPIHPDVSDTPVEFNIPGLIDDSCNLPGDVGGYYIIGGTERFVTMVENSISIDPVLVPDNLPCQGGVSSVIKCQHKGEYIFFRVYCDPKEDCIMMSSSKFPQEMKEIDILSCMLILNLTAREQDYIDEESIGNTFKVFTNLIKRQVNDSTLSSATDYDMESTLISRFLIGTRDKALQDSNKRTLLHILTTYPDERSENEIALLSMVTSVLTQCFIPNTSTVIATASYQAKAKFVTLARHVSMLVEYLDSNANTDSASDQVASREDIELKRYDTAGTIAERMVCNAIYKAYNKVEAGVTPYSIVQDYDSFFNELRSTLGELEDKYRVSDVMLSFRSDSSQVVHTMSRKCFYDSISCIRKIKWLSNSNNPDVNLRQIQPAQQGYICLAETPEGKDIGMVKALASTAVVSEGISTAAVTYLICNLLKSTIVMYDDYVNSIALVDTTYGEYHRYVGNQMVDLCRSSIAKTVDVEDYSLDMVHRNIKLINEFLNYARDQYDLSATLHKDHVLRRSHKSMEKFVESETAESWMPLYLDGAFIGYCHESIEQALTTVKRLNPMYKFVCYKRTASNMYIHTDAMRLLRPLMNVRHGFIELVDIAQTKSTDFTIRPFGLSDRVSITSTWSQCIGYARAKKIKYLEIHPSAVLGIAASLTPMVNHSSAARATFQSSMSKQVLSCDPYYAYGTFDQSKFMFHAHVPLMQTDMKRVIDRSRDGSLKRANGFNLIVAMQSLGNNQEDGIVVGEGLLQSGLCDYVKMRVQRTSRIGEQYVPFNYELTSSRNKHWNGITLNHGPSSMYDSAGIIQPNVIITKGDVIATKIKTHNQVMIQEIKTICQVPMRTLSVMLNTRDGSMDADSICVVAYKVSRPRVGDKMTSGHAQKGVICQTIPACYSYSTSSGVTPELYFNPHGMPSRMTMGHPVEGYLNRLFIKHQVPIVDGTSFMSKHLSMTVSDNLAKYGDMCETMYDRRTGRRLKTKVNVVILNYNFLKHQVEDKSNVRNRGPLTQLFNQAPKGIKNNGGIRIGEMEADALVAHGASAMLEEKFLGSDQVIVRLCESPSCTMNYAFHNKTSVCVRCGSNLVNVAMPKAYRVMTHILNTMNVKTQMFTSASSKPGR
ncbi:DNA-dependent RNA polymerase II [Geranomyces michiganensis]|nr:DNA-dependent RNA polymerase II [Geranomyces michiganensis]